MEKYKILNPEFAIGCYPISYCLVYGNKGDGCGVYLPNNFLSSNFNRENHSNKVYNVPSDHGLTGENDFEIQEVEVYQVIFK